MERRLRSRGRSTPELLWTAKRAGLLRRPDRARSPTAAGADVRCAARSGRHAPGLQDGRHLRRRVRGGDAVLLLHLRGGERSAAARRRRRRVVIGSGPIRIGQGIEFDYCSVHAAWALQEAGVRGDHDQLEPGDGLHRLRHLRPALLRAARRGVGARHPARTRRGDGDGAAGRSSSSAARPRSTWPSRSSRAACAILGSQRRGDRPGRGPASASRTSCAELGIPQPPGAARHARSSEALRRRRADRLPGAGAAVATCSAAGRWRSSRTRPS